MNIKLNQKQIYDLEMILNGGFAPLQGFMNQQDYQSVLQEMRLSDNTLWPIPIVLAVEKNKKSDISKADKIVLTDTNDLPLAHLYPEDIYQPDLEQKCQAIFNSNDSNHDYISSLLAEKDFIYVGGPVERVESSFTDYDDLIMSAQETKNLFAQKGWQQVVGFQTRNPMHRSHLELTLQAADSIGPEAKIFINPVMHSPQSEDIDLPTRIKCYQQIMKYYPEDKAHLALLPLSMRMAGPREALWHALIRKNYGCTHFIVGRDHAGPSVKKQDGEDFFSPYQAQELLSKYETEIGIRIIKLLEVVYVPELDKYLTADKVPKNMKTETISGTELRKRLKNKEDIPEWFSFKEVIKELY